MIAEFPLGLENLEKWEGIYFPVREKSENFQQTGKRRKKNKILEKSGKFRQMLFIIVSWYLNELCSIY